MSTVDLDLIVVSPRAVYVCEEKSWGRHVVAGDVGWYVNGERRHSPNSQVQHATRVLAGASSTGSRLARGGARVPARHRIVRGHVVLSHDCLDLEGAADLGEDVVLRLAETAATLLRLDGTCPDGDGPLCARSSWRSCWASSSATPAEPPRQIYQYRVEGPPMRRGNATVYGARIQRGSSST